MFIEDNEDPSEETRILSLAQREKHLHDEVMELAKRVSEAVLETRPTIVEFVVSGTTFAVMSQNVSEVHVLRDVTPVPCTPAWVVGIVNVRGQLVTVADLRKVLGLSVGRVLVFNKLVILQSDENKIGILVDDVLGARIVEDSGFVVPIDEASPYTKFAGTTTSQGSIILDVQKIFASPEFVVEEEVV